MIYDELVKRVNNFHRDFGERPISVHIDQISYDRLVSELGGISFSIKVRNHFPNKVHGLKVVIDEGVQGICLTN